MENRPKKKLLVLVREAIWRKHYSKLKGTQPLDALDVIHFLALETGNLLHLLTTEQQERIKFIIKVAKRRLTSNRFNKES
jgi:hypothetical protein